MYVFFEKFEFNFKLQILLRKYLNGDLVSAEVMKATNLPAIMLPLKVTLTACYLRSATSSDTSTTVHPLYMARPAVSCVLNCGNCDYVYFLKSFPSTLCEMKLALIVIGEVI